MNAVLALKLKSYLQVPPEQLVVAMGRSMDLLISALKDRDPDSYVSVQKANFKARVAAGIDVSDLNAVLAVANEVMTALITEGIGSEAGRASLLSRTQRYLSLTAMALTDVVLSK